MSIIFHKIMTKILSLCALLSIDNYNTEFTITENSCNILQDAYFLSARTEGVLTLQGFPKSL